MCSYIIDSLFISGYEQSIEDHRVATISLHCLCVRSSNLLQSSGNKMEGEKKFQNCVLMMGLFHMLMMFMHILSKRFADAGLRDVLIQSNVIAEGSVDRALCGKMYSRGVRMYKLVYETNHDESLQADG